MQLIIIGVVLLIPYICGAVASFFYFIRANNNKIYSGLIYLTSIWGMLYTFYYTYSLIVGASQYFSMNNTISLVLKIAIYALIVYQTHTLKIKRKNALEVSKK